MSSLFRKSLISATSSFLRYNFHKPTRMTKGGLNFHQSKRSQRGLYHGKDVQSGHSISFSHHKTKRRWLPNVQYKRVYSEAMNKMVFFRMTTAAMRAIDKAGGIDTYILRLDNAVVDKSRDITRERLRIASRLFHAGKLTPVQIKKLGYHKNPPPNPFVEEEAAKAYEKELLHPPKVQQEHRMRLKWGKIDLTKMKL